MNEKSTQMTTALIAGRSITHYLLAPLQLTKWSVQGSNLRPPVRIGTCNSGSNGHTEGASAEESPALGRTSGESAASKSNQKAIHLPDPYADSRIFLAWRFVA